MTLSLKEISLGEIDGRNEFLSQSREDSQVFMKSFLNPPNVDPSKILSGSKFFISGAKGSGKTAMVWYLKRVLEEQNHTTHVVLFKSDLTEFERQRLIQLSDISAMVDQKKLNAEYDYKQNWLWYIVKSFVRMIDDRDVVEGTDIVRDLKRLTGSDTIIKPSIFSGLQLTKIKAQIQAVLSSGPLTSKLKIDLEAAKKQTDDHLFHMIHVCEEAFSQIKIRRDKRYYLFFDELELFVDKPDQKTRDLFLIRDLLYGVSRINRKFGEHSALFIAIASVRSEILDAINRVGPETKREVDDFGLLISWEALSDAAHHPLVSLIERKIQASYAEADQEVSGDIWGSYFPKVLYRRPIRQYLFDISMCKPRNLIRLLRDARSFQPEAFQFTTAHFEERSTMFSSGVWSEVGEELQSRYDSEQTKLVKSALSGFKATFTREEFEARLDFTVRGTGNNRKIWSNGFSSEEILELLYRTGAVGNLF